MPPRPAAGQRRLCSSSGGVQCLSSLSCPGLQVLAGVVPPISRRYSQELRDLVTSLLQVCEGGCGLKVWLFVNQERGLGLTYLTYCGWVLIGLPDAL